MREKSRMSEISVSRVSPEQRMVFSRSHCAGDSAVSASSCPTAEQQHNKHCQRCSETSKMYISTVSPEYCHSQH